MATTLKIDPKLKRQVARAAKERGISSHAFMLKAIRAETERAELRRSFIEDALAAEREMIEKGEAYDADDVHEYIMARAAGRKVKRPKPIPWPE